MKKLKQLLSTAMVVPAFALGVVLFTAVPAYAAFDLSIGDGAIAAQGKDQEGDAASLFGDGGQGGIFRTITNVMLFIIGAISVIMLIIGGIRYVLSGGNQEKVAEAKNTILYAIVGVVVAILAFAVVNFVIQSFTDGN